MTQNVLSILPVSILSWLNLILFCVVRAQCKVFVTSFLPCILSHCLLCKSHCNYFKQKICLIDNCHCCCFFKFCLLVIPKMKHYFDFYSQKHLWISVHLSSSYLYFPIEFSAVLEIFCNLCCPDMITTSHMSLSHPWNTTSAIEEQNFKLYLVLITLNSHIWVVASFVEITALEN